MKNTGFILSIIIYFSLQENAIAQYQPINNIPFYKGGYELSAALAGGMNAAQFSETDFNGDGKKDLFIFERSSNTFITLLNSGEGIYTYTPEYQSAFPQLTDWALLRDYNCDGLPDLFTYYIGSTKVFKGVLIDGNLSFIQEKERITYYDEDSETDVAIYTSRTDIPTIDDIDGDGDLDILSFSVSNTTIRFYKNISFESGFSCDSLKYDLVEYCWGMLYEGFSCGGGDLGIVCKGGPDANIARELHTGSTSLTLDKDGDGDKDLILGDNSCNNLVYYLNGGDNEFAEMVSKDTLFPSNTVSYFAPDFPGIYLIDADNDGDQDLIATPNDDLLGLNTDNIWLYENLNTNDTFDFDFFADTFLVSSMVDAGNYSYPVYFDYNNDGLQDIVIGVNNTYGHDQIFHHGLWLYKNIGTASSPAFLFITKDFASLDTYPLNQLTPFFADADQDGDDDLFCGTYDGTIIYLENLSGPTGEAEFADPVFVYQGIDVGQNSAPCLFDMDEDGKLDMVVGEMNGNLNYYHNTGTVSDPVFTLENEIFGGVDVREEGYVTGYSKPFFFKNENDSINLLVGSQSGKIYLFNEIEDALLGEFYEADTNYLEFPSGTFISIMRSDIDADGKTDYLTGSIRGGIQVFERINPDAITNYHSVNQFNIYPNPATTSITISLKTNLIAPHIVKIMNASGMLISQVEMKSEILQIPVHSFPNGIYFIQISGEEAPLSRCFVIAQ